MPSRVDAAKQRIDRILKRFTDPTTPELMGFVSGMNDASSVGSIDDGSYGDPVVDTRPDFVKRDNAGWTTLR